MTRSPSTTARTHLDPAGEVLVRWHRDGDASHVEVASCRPLGAVGVLRGRTLDEVVDTLPRLFSVCAGAQTVACVAACERALGIATPDTTAAVRDAVLRVEAIREHLWRLLIDWPSVFGLRIDAAPVAEAMQHERRFRNAAAAALRLGGTVAQVADAPLDALRRIATRYVFGRDPADWLDAADGDAPDAADPLIGTDAAIRDRGWRELGAHPLDALPPPDLAWFDARLAADADGAFVARPALPGGVPETGVGARSPALGGDASHPGLWHRWHARRRELARLLVTGDGLHGAAASYAAGTGIAHAEAARGMLIHRVEQRDGRAIRYQILAPTEWNFHPRGVLARALATLPGDDPAAWREQARALLVAIDPCVAYRVEVDPEPGVDTGADARAEPGRGCRDA